MLPTHGSVTSVFHLANAIRHNNQPDIASWVCAARDRSAFLAAAIDHQPAATVLIRKGLVSSIGGIRPTARLQAVSGRANRTTLVAIAAMLLELDPPAWLPVAVVDGKVHYEVIPSKDIESLEWLRPELEQLLLDAALTGTPRSNLLALGIGRAAELAVLEALTDSGRSAIHLADISDSFGYDIESTNDTGVRRWEVKAGTERTAGTFHLTRNEFEKCAAYRSEWTIVRVEFAGAALVAEHVTAADITRVQELPAAELLALVPLDTDHFHWETSALVTPPAHAWAPSSIEVPSTLQLPSFDALGHQVLQLRQVPSRDRIE
jgi:hypothetical protein